MRKILIVALLAAIFTGLEAICACPIDGLLNGQKSCTVGLQDQGQTIQDKLMPNNLNQMVNPSRNTSKEFKRPPHTMPETINTDTSKNPEMEEGNKPYNAACQFGVCLPGENNGRKN